MGKLGLEPLCSLLPSHVWRLPSHSLGVAVLCEARESGSEGVIAKFSLSFSCTTFPPLRSVCFARSPPAHFVSCGEEEVGRGPNGGGSQPRACVGPRTCASHGHHFVCPSSAALILRVVYIPVPQTEPS